MNIGMKQFTAVVHRGESGEGGFWATCLEVPGANGQGETKEECLADLKKAIQLLAGTKREASGLDSAWKLPFSSSLEIAGAWLGSVNAADNSVSQPRSTV